MYSRFGVFFMLAGAVSSVLYLIRMNLAILGWIDAWGPSVGWAIRGGLIVFGVVLFAIGSRKMDMA